MDSVFGRFVADAPIVAPAIVEGMETVESRYADLLIDAIAQAVDRVILQTFAAETAEDVNAIQFGLRPLADPILFSLWQDAYALGGQDGLNDIRAVINQFRRRQGARVALYEDPMAVVEALRIVSSTTPPQLINIDAIQAVSRRTNLLAGNFSDDIFSDLKRLIRKSIQPQPNTGVPISREKFLEEIETLLEVSSARARNIARTETTYAYNGGRLSAFKAVPAVDYVRILVIDDDRLTDICRSRAGLIMPVDDLSAAGGAPPYHYQCRSTISPVLSILASNQAMIDDPENSPDNRDLVPLLPGWQ